MKYQPGWERNITLASNEISAWQGMKWERNQTWLAKKSNLTSKKISAWQGKKWDLASKEISPWLAMKYHPGKE
jgi:hypothetical protein